jgi:hypothetical protein
VARVLGAFQPQRFDLDLAIEAARELEINTLQPARLSRGSLPPMPPNSANLTAYCLCVYLTAALLLLGFRSLMRFLF